jgi:hypothetical protein
MSNLHHPNASRAGQYRHNVLSLVGSAHRAPLMATLHTFARQVCISSHMIVAANPPDGFVFDCRLRGRLMGFGFGRRGL